MIRLGSRFCLTLRSGQPYYVLPGSTNGGHCCRTRRCRLQQKTGDLFKEGGNLIIEDDELARAVMERMIAAGIPILRRDELPPTEGSTAKTLNEMVDAKNSPKEINLLWIQARKKDKARWNAIVEWQRQRDAERPPNTE